VSLIQLGRKLTRTAVRRVWHPNIDLTTGKVMMPILGQDWRPVLSINTVLLGLQVSSGSLLM
jgi:ubiquitin-protein ligase